MRKFVGELIAWGPAGVFVLAAMDSAGVPLPGGVDALLLTVSILRPESAWLAAVAAILGSLLGNWFLFSLGRKGGEALLKRQTASGRGKVLKDWFLRYGLVTVFVPALLPIPLPMKIPVLCTAVSGVPRVRFLAVVAAARIPRYFGLAWLGMQLRENAAGWLKAHALEIILFAAALFAALFLLVRVSDRGRPDESASFSS
jgi:membrane protein DedA with SNARE-associated domain